MSPSEFKVKMRAWSGATQAQITAVARQSIQEVCFRIVERTPVDTGFLRGSWQPSIGEPQLASGADKAPGKEDATGAAAQAAIGLVIQGIEAGAMFYLTNNASYAQDQEFGTSKMAGRHFVSDSVAEWPKIVKATAKELGL